eukprot:TRINITY_DN237_c0_g2_i1.p1 TRINITY_DN237_c0_g2~~TRINITY_DN237_c0_g2_i1.p1  ORF type:complete len:703 (-),score=269.94 TRINITY_DN237_c0_g2_i1:62-2170(-)
MKGFTVVCASALVGQCVAAKDATEVNPIQKVVSMLGDLKGKVEADGKLEDESYAKYDKFCVKAKRDIGYEIQTGESSVEELTAAIDKAASDVGTSQKRASDLAKDIESNNKALSEAFELNKKETGDYKASVAELKDSIDMLGKAMDVLSKKLASKDAALLQTNKQVKAEEDGFVKALGAIVDAASTSHHEKSSLTAFLNTATKQAPAVPAYTSKSGGIVEILDEMKDKARSDLSDIEDALTKCTHEFKMKKGSLSAQIAADEKELEQVKAALAEARTAKSAGEADLSGTSKDLEVDKATLTEYENSCSQAKTDYEASKASRSEEIKAVEKATQIIQEKTGNAEERIYDTSSFVQVSAHSQLKTAPASGSQFEVAEMISKLAKKSQTKEITRLAGDINSLVQTGSGDDVFKDIIDLLKNMIADKQETAAKDASKKQYCDTEKAKTAAKFDELSDTNDKTAATVEMQKSEAVTMQGEADTLASELKALVEQQAEMDSTRKEDAKIFAKTKEDMESGLEGVRTALSVLKDYYQGTEEAPAEGSALAQTGEAPPSFGHSKDAGASEGIIGMLEVVEYDFNKDLVAAETAEETAEAEYVKITDENKVTKIQKDADQKYKAEVATTLNKKLQEKITEKEAIEQELASVVDYQKSIEEQCREGGISYEERVQKREQEIAALKDALKKIGGSDLTGEALVQAPGLRGSRK